MVYVKHMFAQLIKLMLDRVINSLKEQSKRSFSGCDEEMSLMRWDTHMDSCNPFQGLFI